MTMKQTRNIRIFFQYVIPSVLSFALSGVYAIVDGFFIGNSIGDLGLSAVNVAYPVVGVIQALGTGIGMGGAIYYSIYKAEKKRRTGKKFYSRRIVGTDDFKRPCDNTGFPFEWHAVKIIRRRWRTACIGRRIYCCYRSGSFHAGDWHRAGAFHPQPGRLLLRNGFHDCRLY